MPTSLELVVGGMHCDACARRLRKALERVQGLRVDAVEVGRVRVTLETTTAAEVSAAIASTGFSVVEHR